MVQINAWLPRLRYGEGAGGGVDPLPLLRPTACLNWPLSQGAEFYPAQVRYQDFYQYAAQTPAHGAAGSPPTLFVALINHPDLAAIDFSQMWACISGSAPLPQEVRDRFEEITPGCRIMEGYGLTEAGPVTHLNPYQRERPPGSIGLPFFQHPGKNNGRRHGQSESFFGWEVGELVVQGPQVMSGYWQRAEETAQVLRDGWLFTGDLAKMDENGYFYIIDRKKDLIIDAGFKIYPREVEEVLYQHPGGAGGSGLRHPGPLPGGTPEGGHRSPPGGAFDSRRHPGILPAALGHL